MSKIKDEKERKILLACGQRIRKLREEHRYSQEKLAEYLDCSVVSLGRAERGEQSLKIWRLNRVCKLFHVSLDYLLRDFDPSDVSPVPTYLIELFEGADEAELHILSDHMLSAGRTIEYIRALKAGLQKAPSAEDL